MKMGKRADLGLGRRLYWRRGAEKSRAKDAEVGVGVGGERIDSTGFLERAEGRPLWECLSQYFWSGATSLEHLHFFPSVLLHLHGSGSPPPPLPPPVVAVVAAMVGYLERGRRSWGGTGMDAIMYLYMMVCLSSSCLWSAVNAPDDDDDSDLPAVSVSPDGHGRLVLPCSSKILSTNQSKSSQLLLLLVIKINPG